MDFGPPSPIVAALLSAICTAVISCFVLATRKNVTFWIAKTEDLTLPLRKHHESVVLKLGDREMGNLNRAAIVAKNTGNTAINDFAFEIEIPGVHKECMAEKRGRDEVVLEAIAIESDERGAENRKFGIKLAFFNANEVFRISLFFDNTADECKVHCRIQGVKVRVKTGAYLSPAEMWEAMREQPKATVAIIFLAMFIGFGALTVASIISAQVMELLRLFFPTLS